MKTKYNVKLLNGSKQEVTYSGIETITLPDADSEGVKKFTAGEPLDSVPIVPNFSEGDQTVDAPEGYVVRGAVIKKPANAEQVIGKGETLAGIAGEYVTPGTTKEIVPDFSAGDQTVQAEGDERWNAATVRKPETLLPENIIESVNIAGVIGTFKNQKAPRQLIEPPGEAFSIADWMFDAPPEAIKSNAFESASITNVNLSKVTSIGRAAFSGCKMLSQASLPLLSSLKFGAFNSCVKLAAVNFPNLTSVADFAFDGCTLLSDITLNPSVSFFGYGAIRDTAYYGNSENAENGVLYLGNVAVGAKAKTISGMLSFREGTTCTGGDGFYWCSKITGVSCSTLKWIGESTFRSCSYITEVDLPAVEVIYQSAFQSCFRLQSANFPQCSLIGSGAFENCSALSSVNFPECTFVSGNAFKQCSNLLFARFSKCSLIEYSTFAQCTKLTEVEMPLCSWIGFSAFARCSNLSKAVYSACSSIGANAFLSCSSLAMASFPAVTSIGASAFMNCVKLTSLYFLGSQIPKLSNSMVFGETPMLISSGGIYGSIFVRTSLLSAFKSALYWSKLSARIVGLTDDEIAALEEST